MKYYKAESADIIGDVRLSDNCSIYYNAVIRADHHPVTIGKNTNIQDCCVLHTGENNPVIIGENVTIGHGAIIHGCEIGNNVLIGMGAVIMNGARIGDYSIIGAGALVTENTVIDEGLVAIGTPAKVVRKVTDKEREYSKKHAMEYVENAVSILNEVEV